MKTTKMTLAALSTVGLLTISQAFATDWSAYSSKHPIQSTSEVRTENIKGGLDTESLNSKHALIESKSSTTKSIAIDRTQVCSKKDMMTPAQCAAHCGM